MDFYKGTIPIIDDSVDGDAMAFPGMVSYGAIPRDYNIQPPEMFDGLEGLTVVDPSEWDARFDEQEQQQTSLEHLFLKGGNPAFVNLDQDGDGYSHSADTEVLTEFGWVPWPQWNRRDLLATVNPFTHQLEFQAHTECHAYRYKDEMYYSTNRRLDFGVTRNHRMLIRRWDERRRTLSKEYTFQRADSLGWYVGMMSAPRGFIGTEFVELEIEGDRRYDGDDFIAMLSLIISDGYAGGSESTHKVVSFCCFDEKRYAFVAALAARVGFREQSGRRGVWSRQNASALAAWIRANCYISDLYRSHCKKVPDLVKCASMRQISLFLQWYGDKDHFRQDEEVHFYSSSKRLIDDLQELHLRIGKRGSIFRHDKRRSIMRNGHVINSKESWELYVSKTNRLCIDRKKHIETDKYNDLVYCATVPNGTLITRRNGSILISGNCWAYSTGQALMLTRLRENQPLVRLNPHGPAAIIKGGRDEGGWCGLSAQFVREHGYPVEGTGPGQWPLHSRSLKYDTPECRQQMALHKAEEFWIDLTKPVYDQTLSRNALATCLFTNNPCATDYAWWGHSVCALRWVRVEKGNWGILILNSWKDWGRFGLSVLTGSKANFMGAICLRSSTASKT